MPKDNLSDLLSSLQPKPGPKKPESEAPEKAALPEITETKDPNIALTEALNLGTSKSKPKEAPVKEPAKPTASSLLQSILPDNSEKEPTQGPPAPSENTASQDIEKIVQEAVDKAIQKIKAEGTSTQEKDKPPKTSLQRQPAEKPTTSLTSGRSHDARPHAFVVMPFGKKKGFDGNFIDFNRVYSDLIRPALEDAGFESFRADEETVSGDILTDMFQELLLADLVIADMSIDNANVFYELGVRHAMRKRGIVHIQSGRAYMPFDIFNVRTIPYHLNADGVPDPDFLDKDKQAISRVTRDTYKSEQETIHSPIYNLLTGLKEPDRKTLRTPLATGFWREYNEWKQRVTVAQRQKRIGDILLLTEEISNPLIKEEAITEAGNSLRAMGRDSLALEQYRRGLEINSSNTEFRRQEAFHLNRLGRVDEAIVKLENLVSEHPDDSEAIGYLGRIYKDMWMDAWTYIEDSTKRVSEAYESYHWLIKSIETYLKGYRANLINYYPGVNALTLATCLKFLADRFEDPSDLDPDIQSVLTLLPELQGTLKFALDTFSAKENSDYWALISLADWYVLTADTPRKVIRAYKKALPAARKNIYSLQSAINSLHMLKKLDLFPANVEAGITVLSDEIRRIHKDQEDEDPKGGIVKPSQDRVFLFSGHNIDTEKSFHRFPVEMEPEVKEKIQFALHKLNANENDLAITAGLSAGGEIIFVETCLEMGMKVEAHLPNTEAFYIRENVAYAGDSWVERFYGLRNHPNLTVRLQEDHIGKVKVGDNIYERNNRWATYSSLVQGINRVRLIALWDGKASDAADANGLFVAHMVEQMRRMGGQVEHLNTTKFEYWKAGGKVGKALDKLAGM